MTIINHTEVRAHRTLIVSIRNPGGTIQTFIALLAMLGMSVIESCLDPYSAPASLSHVNYLVVDGFLSDSNGPTVIRLSRTTPLISGDTSVPERNAIVEIEDDQGDMYTLTEMDSGSYSGTLSTITPDKNYRLKIRTSSNKDYESDFVPFKATPVIDSVNWAIDGNDIHIYANTHDDNNNTRYYYWKYEETWAYHSAFQSLYKFVDGQIILRDADDDIFHCWKTLPSSQIEISSSTKLALDIISNYTLAIIPLTSEKFRIEYSLLLHQFALTKDGFEYWQELKKNTENIGTIFGPQPSQIASNIHCITNPEEPVIGWFSACSNQQKRIFILNAVLPSTRHDTGYESCEQDTLFIKQIPDFKGTELVTSGISKGMPPVLIGYFKSNFGCVDCRVHGGTNVRPDFWK